MNAVLRLLIFLPLAVLSVCCNDVTLQSDLRAPAYPIVTIDPYMSVWSPADRLYDENLIHWSGKEFPLIGVLKVDGKPYRFMGDIAQNDMCPVAHMGKDKAWEAAYTFEEPSGDWTSADYDDSGWARGDAPFGEGHVEVNTPWTTPEIWLRREVKIDRESMTDDRYFVYFTHDGRMEIFINGEEVVATGNSWKENARVEITREQLERWDYTLEMAAHCKWFSDARYVDFGICHNDETAHVFGQSAVQTSVDAFATRTVYGFTCGGVDMKLTFAAPLLMEDPELVSRPVNYISYELVSNDGHEHDVEIYFEASQDWARNDESQSCTVEVSEDERFAYVKCGTEDQEVLGRCGDNVRIDWGYFYLVGDKSKYDVGRGESESLRDVFASTGRTVDEAGTDMAVTSVVGKVGGRSVKDYIMVGYDEGYSIRYFNENIRPYWNRRGDSSIEEQFALAADQYDRLMKKCAGFDAALMSEAGEAGGKEYAELCALAYRQCMAAHKLIETPSGNMAWLSKENSSNGCIGTVDVTYPSFPMFLYYNLDFAKALLNFIYEYSESNLWTEPYAPHDVGTYPHVFGQRYDGGMPVEESGNMLVMTGAVCKVEGKADYAMPHWETLTRWADYLVAHGGDPINQLCTDDFMGHSARNANLAAKAVLGVAAYADMAGMAGMKEVSAEYYGKAREMAAGWKRMAYENDHYRLTFDPGQDTWSQKYNLVWDNVLGYDVFDDDIIDVEISYYRSRLNRFGLPLDSRDVCTKSDWLVWTATMSEDYETFREFVVPMYDFYDMMTARVPMPDLYHTTSKAHSGGWMQARSVVGGYWIKMLSDRMLSK